MEQKGIKGKDYFFGIRYLFTALIIFKKITISSELYHEFLVS